MIQDAVESLRRMLRSVASKTVRFVAREAADELVKRGVAQRLATEIAAAGPPRTVRIDAPDLVAQLASSKSRRHLNHLFAWNHRWIALLAERNRRNAVDAYDFIDETMPDAVFEVDQFAVVQSKVAEIRELDGYVLDFGVYRGSSTRALARIFPDETIHGFDSFEGLPEDWGHMLAGGFGDVKGQLPHMPANVQLHKGWFDDTVPVWHEQHHDRPISLLRVDCDLYSSTRTIFTVLQPMIQSGTWILFDELIGYRGWRDHEYRAFLELIDETNLHYEYVAYGLTYTLVRLK